VEALGEVIAENPRGIMWRKDELSGLIADMDKYAGTGSVGGKSAEEIRDVIACQQAARARQRVQAMTAKMFDMHIVRYGADFCVRLGEYAAKKTRRG